jgi:hypothetical protein
VIDERFDYAIWIKYTTVFEKALTKAMQDKRFSSSFDPALKLFPEINCQTEMSTTEPD